MHQSPRSFQRTLSWQHIILVLCFIAFLASFVVLVRRFYLQHTLLVPSIGGTYIEGSTGELQSLNPWFTVTNDVNRDIVSLVFSGLLKYNPQTQQIEEDLATLEIGADNRIYTLTLKENIFWHDSVPENPHPVTPEDVLFTFKTIQHPSFPNSLLRQNFLGVEVEQLDDRTVRFRLEEPYSFFTSNLTLGLLPARSFEGIPVEKLNQTLDFGFHPIGAGPYAFKSLMQTELSSEVTLERFARVLDQQHYLHRIIFRVFPDYPTLLSDIRNLDGVRLVPRNDKGEPIVPRQFRAVHYTLPQYVALFLNLDRRILQDRSLRLGLQLGTNKQAIVDAIGEQKVVDTPLLEIDQTDWRYQFDPEAAQGAFFSSSWHRPEKVRLQRLLEMREANDVGALRMDAIVLLDTGGILSVTGSLLDTNGTGALLNGLPIRAHPTSTGAWVADLSTDGSTGSLLLGQNLLKLTTPQGTTIDSFYLWRTHNPSQYRRAVEEQQLLELFLQSRGTGDLSDEDQLTVQDLYLEDGFLRRRFRNDPHDVRINRSGNPLILTLLTSSSPPQYQNVAQIVKKQWAPLGVRVDVVVPTSRQEFEERLLSRDYDILLFGQSLLDNLDSYPYWHSAGVQKLTGNRNDIRLDAYNLSQYSSLEADSLLEVIRQTNNEQERMDAMQELDEVLRRDVPAIFLYSPLYTYAYDKELHGVELGELSLHSDRFLMLRNWYLKEERVFLPKKSWLSFFPWLFSFLR